MGEVFNPSIEQKRRALIQVLGQPLENFDPPRGIGTARLDLLSDESIDSLWRIVLRGVRGNEVIAAARKILAEDAFTGK